MSCETQETTPQRIPRLPGRGGPRPLFVVYDVAAERCADLLGSKVVLSSESSMSPGFSLIRGTASPKIPRHDPHLDLDGSLSLV